MRVRTFPLTAPVTIRLAVLADFHSANTKKQNNPAYLDDILQKLHDIRPDWILAPGDIFNHADAEALDTCFNQNGLRLLSEARSLSPVFYSIGNHDMGLSADNRALLERRGIVVLDDEWVTRDGISIGGMSSGYKNAKNSYKIPPVPDTHFPDRFSAAPGYRILLCHHPEYWEPYVQGKGMDLTIAGHAHGGQWGFFSRGIYAPGQGLFPRYVQGLHFFPVHDRTEVLAVSRGMANTVSVPRFFNPCEIMVLDLRR